jgi:DNA-directed RNA polymerase specialized sigma24 family protein
MAITLRHFEGQSNSEISEHLDVSVESVESLLACGRRAMAATIEREMNGKAQ